MTDPRQPGDDALTDLLHSPLDDAPRPRNPRRILWWAAGVLAAAAAVVALVVLVGGERDEGSAASSTAPRTTPAAGATGASTTAVPADGTGITAAPAHPGSPGYPASRVLALGTPAGPGRMVVFGGADPGGSVVDEVNAETWIYYLADDAWYLADGVGPTARIGAAFTSDPESGVVVLFGGATGRPNYCRVVRRCAPGENAEVWGFDPDTGIWEQQLEAPGPAARFGAVAGYDPEADRMILFGGARTLDENAAVEMFQDTWAYDFDSNAWTEMSPPDPPPARAHSAMTYDPGSGRMLMFGGSGLEREIDATVWAYDFAADTWTALAAEGGPPDATWDASFTYTESIHGVVLIGGEGPLTREIAEGVTATEVGWSDQVWVFEPATGVWSGREPFAGPISGQAAAYDGESERLVVSILGYTFLYDPAADVWDDLTPEE